MSALLKLYSETSYNAETCETLGTTFKDHLSPSLLVLGPHLCGKSTVLKELLQLPQLLDCESGDDILVWPGVWKNKETEVRLLEVSTETSVFPEALAISSVCLLVFSSWEHVIWVHTQINSIQLQDRPELFVLIPSNVRKGVWQKKHELELCNGLSLQILDRSDPEGVRTALAQALRRFPRNSSGASKPTPFQPLTNVDLIQRTPLCLFGASSPSLQLKQDTLSVLWGNFKDCTNICSFLVLGHAQCGKSDLLDTVLEEDSQFCSIEGEEGLYVWPHPFNYSGVNVMLMELSGLNFPKRSASMDKLAAVAMALSSVCGICLEGGSFFTNLNSLLKLGDIARGLLSPPSKYLVFVESREMSKAKWASSIAENKEKYSEHNVNFLSREYSGYPKARILEIKEHLLGCPKDYQSPPAEQEQPPSIIAKFAYLADLCTTIANITETLTDFKIQFPRLKQMYESNFNQFEKYQNSRELARNASKLQLFKCTWESIEVREDTLNTLKSNFDMECETVVLVVLGAQGVGKSTLLNHMIRYTGSLPLQEIFPTGNTTTHTTRDSEVLSCPLWVGPNRDKQCLLIDLEGLGGSETIKLTSLTGQERRVTGILALASVPCIVIGNEKASIDDLKKRVKLISELQQYYKYDVERIVLLFHDRDEAADSNSQWNATLKELETECFGGRAVFRVLNKPSFASSEIEQQEAFLSKLLAECELPRRKQGQIVALSVILKEISAIAHSLESVETLILIPEEEHQYNLIERQIFQQLDEDVKILQSTDTGELLPALDEYIDKLKKDSGLRQCSVTVQRKFLDQLNQRSKQICLDLMRQEVFDLQTKFLSEEIVTRELQQFRYEAELHYKNKTRLFQPSHWGFFDTTIKEEFTQLLGRVIQTSLHFPGDYSRYENLILACHEVRYGDRTLSKLQASPLQTLPNEPFILVVGGLERFLFCNLLVKSLQPLTFPESQIFTAGNQYFDLTYYSSNKPQKVRIVSFDLLDTQLLQQAAKLLSRAAMAYILLDTPTSYFPPVQATESMLNFYGCLRKAGEQAKVVTFLCCDEADLSRCRHLSINGFLAEYKQACFYRNNPALLEASYQAPKILRGLL